MARQKINFKVTDSGAAGIGEVSRVSMDDNSPGVGSVTLRMGPKPKKSTGKGSPEVSIDYPPEVHLDLPASMVKKLKVGQKVRVSVDRI